MITHRNDLESSRDMTTHRNDLATRTWFNLREI